MVYYKKQMWKLKFIYTSENVHIREKEMDCDDFDEVCQCIDDEVIRHATFKAEYEDVWEHHLEKYFAVNDKCTSCIIWPNIKESETLGEIYGSLFADVFHWQYLYVL
jgi:hypothetical protein